MATHSFTLDLKKSYAYTVACITVHAGDSGERLEVDLTRDGAAVDLAGCTAHLMGCKPDRGTVEQPMACSGSVASCTVDPRVFGVPGLLKALYVRVTGAGGLTETTGEILANVLPNAEDLGDLAEGPYIPRIEAVALALSEALEAAGRIESEIAQAEQRRQTAEKTRAESEADRELTEAARVEAEDARAAAESARAANEQRRQTAESTRAQSESDREAAEGERERDEADRVVSERERAAEEERRQSAERTRAESEADREAAEEERQAALAQARSATAAANSAAEAANGAAEGAAAATAEALALLPLGLTVADGALCVTYDDGRE